MRAVRAARDDSKGGEFADNLLQVSLPLMKSIIDELCGVVNTEASSDPKDRSAALALWLLEFCNAPADLVAGVRDWSSTGTYTPQVPKEPRSGYDDSPKKKQAKNANKGDGGPAGGPMCSVMSIAEDMEADDDTVPNMGLNHELQSCDYEAKKKGRQSVAWKRNSQLTTGIMVDDSQDELDFTKETSLPVPGPEMGSPKRSARRSNSGLSPNQMNERKRRFTVNLSSQLVGMPPRAETLALLRNVEAFRTYGEEDLHKIADIARCSRYEVDENIVVHGAPADHLHIVMDGYGKVSALSQVATVKSGDVFGEDALRLSASTNPTQVSAASGPLTTLSIATSAFQILDIKRPHLAKRAKGLIAHKSNRESLVEHAMENDDVGTGACKDSGRAILEGVKPTKEERDVIHLAVANNKMLGEVLQLTPEQCDAVAQAVYAVSLKKDEILFRKGDNAYAFYIIREGFMDVLLDGHTKSGIHFQAGSSFGELALLYDSPRSATLQCSKECTLWVMPRNSFKTVACLSFKQRIREYSELIGKIPAIANTFGTENLDMLADVIEEVTVLNGENLCEAGEDDGQIFVIFTGECEMERGDEVIKLGKGDWVGEEQVLKGIPASFTVVCTSEEVTALVLDTSGLRTATEAQKQVHALHNQTLDEDHVLKEDMADRILEEQVLHSYESHEEHAGKPKANIFSMVRLGVLGEGSFGSVVMLKDTETAVTYALKALCKKHIAAEKMETHLANERSVMSILDSDFIVRLYASYVDAAHVYFLLEPVMGGELFDVYSERNLFGDFNCARFYMACVTLALEHMHSKRVIYRDLKLENCLLDVDGYVKLTDMGIAKIVLGKTYTICGTADYFAPETLRQTGHNRAVDWWASGVMLFIMCVGRSPFDAEDVTQIYKNIIKGFSKVKFPAAITSDLSDVIKSLCRKKPEERVTMQKGGADSLKEMPWFCPIQWDKLAEKTMPAPWVPEPVSLEKIAANKLTRDFDLDVRKLSVWDGDVTKFEEAPEDLEWTKHLSVPHHGLSSYESERANSERG